MARPAPKQAKAVSTPLAFLEMLGDLPAMVLDARERIVHLTSKAADAIGAARPRLQGRPLAKHVELSSKLSKSRTTQDLRGRSVHSGAPLRLIVWAAPRGSERLILLLDDRERATAAQLKDRLQSTHRTFLQSVSHDLRVPLASAAGYASLLRRDPHKSALGPDGAHFLERLQANIEHLDEMLHHLLELSRVGVGHRRVRTIKTRGMIESVIEQFAQKIIEVRAQVRVAADLPDVVGDELQLRRVFQNLIDNALKFRGDRPLRVEIGYAPADGGWFTVSDNGRGISEALQPKIWEPFNKLDPTMPGAGIGLSLVRRILEEYGGSIRLDSRLGEGSTFYVRLPLSSPRT